MYIQYFRFQFYQGWFQKNQTILCLSLEACTKYPPKMVLLKVFGLRQLEIQVHHVLSRV